LLIPFPILIVDVSFWFWLWKFDSDSVSDSDFDGWFWWLILMVDFDGWFWWLLLIVGFDSDSDSDYVTLIEWDFRFSILESNSEHYFSMNGEFILWLWLFIPSFVSDCWSLFLIQVVELPFRLWISVSFSISISIWILICVLYSYYISYVDSRSEYEPNTTLHNFFQPDLGLSCFWGGDTCRTNGTILARSSRSTTLLFVV